MNVILPSPARTPAVQSTMKSCFSENAVRIACSGASAAAAAPPAANATSPRAWTMSAVTTVYRSRLSASAKDLLIHVTWSLHGPALSVAVYDASSSMAAGGPRHLHGRKGSDTFTSGSCVVGVFWDYASARYDGAGRPDPASGFYVAVVADAEFVLLLGDMSRRYVDRLHAGIPIAGAGGSSRMARRHERFVVGACGCWSTKARFSESGPEHEIGVALAEEAWVSVDGRKVVQLRRLRCNFRGTRTFFLDGGAPVDMTWDLHGWLFHDDDDHHDPSAIFTFHARSASERRLSWWTDDNDDDGQAVASGQGFCLLIQGFRNITTTA